MHLVYLSEAAPKLNLRNVDIVVETMLIFFPLRNIAEKTHNFKNLRKHFPCTFCKRKICFFGMKCYRET